MTRPFDRDSDDWTNNNTIGQYWIWRKFSYPQTGYYEVYLDDNGVPGELIRVLYYNSALTPRTLYDKEYPQDVNDHRAETIINGHKMFNYLFGSIEVIPCSG